MSSLAKSPRETPRVRVLIIDDSALVRELLSKILASDPGIDVVGTAPDPYSARRKIKELNPDVLTLDVEMPKMDGVTFLRNLMRLRPMPVVMVSSLTEKGADVTLEALELGAVDFVSKPKIDLAHTLEQYADELKEKVRTASAAKVRALTHRPAVRERLSVDAVLEKQPHRRHFKTTDQIIAIGASTGGTEAIKSVLQAMPATSPGVVIAQHIPAAFSHSFAQRMNSFSALTVSEAVSGEQILPGHAYIAPGDKHLIVRRDGARYVCELNDGVPVNRHRPSVDVLFRSVVHNAGANAIGALLTGMGDDGARGLKELRDAGAATVAQDEETSVVWGMPGAAVKLGGAVHVLALHDIADRLLKLAQRASP